MVDLLPPLVDRDRLMPYAPDECSLLLSSRGVPCVLPIHRGVPREDAAPSGSAQVHRLINVPDPAPGLFGGEVKQWGASRPAEPVGVEIKLEDRAVEEQGGVSLGAAGSIHDSNFLDYTGEPVFIVKVLFNR